MARTIDKIDVVEALTEELDEKFIEGLGFTLAYNDDEWGNMILQTWPDGDDKPSVDFMCRITRLRNRS